MTNNSLQSVTILGSTGSIGEAALDVLARHPQRFRVHALSAATHVERMLEQCRRFRPAHAVMLDPAAAAQLERALRTERLATQVSTGAIALETIAADPHSSIVVAAIVGAAGLLPTLAAVYLEAGRLDEARRCVEDATALMVPGRNWYGLPAGVDLVRALLATAERRWDEAERTFGSAVEVNRRYALPFDEARALAAWGRMHLARGVAGDRARARDRLGEALETFERLEATREIPKLRELLDQLQA